MQFFIETERLILRDLLPTDAEGMFALDSDADVHRYVGGRPVKTIEECRTVIEHVRAQYVANGIGRWAVIEKNTNEFLGWAGLKLITEPIGGRVNHYDLGYRFRKEHWGKGYGTEAARATIKYAWEVMNLQMLCGIANVDNAASRRILEKMGMQYLHTFEYDGSIHAWYELVRPK
jgi:[ribosomal protein S5]-alanine N-acetyltransferase